MSSEQGDGAPAQEPYPEEAFELFAGGAGWNILSAEQQQRIVRDERAHRADLEVRRAQVTRSYVSG